MWRRLRVRSCAGLPPGLLHHQPDQRDLCVVAANRLHDRVLRMKGTQPEVIWAV